jgi:interferon gamma-inducible protein 30
MEQCNKYVWSKKEKEADLNEKFADSVNFTVYYETLCPDCKEFISYQLNDALKVVGSIMNLNLIPYGNARVKKSNKQTSLTN